MRRIAGTMLILGAFGGCTMPQQQTAQRSWPDSRYSQSRTASADGSWQRPDVPQPQQPTYTTDESMTRGIVGLVEEQNTQVGQTVAKPSAPATFPAGIATGSAPVPVPAGMTNSASGVIPVAGTIDTAVQGMHMVGDSAAMTLPADVTPPSALELPHVGTESKQVPISVALDTKASIPGSAALRLVNTKRFTLSYAVQDSGTGVSSVDLWETRDGKVWKLCENVQAQQNAYLVEVKDDGVYGYAMVARPKNDLGNTQPKAGDVPQVWVTVDTIKPVVSLNGVEMDLASKAPNLIVRWSAKDRNFGPRPITLCYADQCDGPWLPLASNIENSGRYECAVPSNIPKHAFLRVEARGSGRQLRYGDDGEDGASGFPVAADGCQGDAAGAADAGPSAGS